MKDKLKTILSTLNFLTPTEIADGLACFQSKTIQKNETLLAAGKVCNWIAFVDSGILRNCYISSKGEEVTYCLTFPNTFITAYSSFITGKETFENIHAITDAEILVIHKQQYLDLIHSSTNWLHFSKIFAEQSYILMENRLLALQMESAEKRYADLIQKHPEYFQQIPLKYLASYLGITQRHLSRLRKQLK